MPVGQEDQQGLGGAGGSWSLEAVQFLKLGLPDWYRGKGWRHSAIVLLPLLVFFTNKVQHHPLPVGQEDQQGLGGAGGSWSLKAVQVF